jgi:ubiquinone/menaquinone biosynthesis C-methylase UbiE
MHMKPTCLTAILCLAAAATTVSQERPKPEQIYRHPKLEITLPDFPAEGLILDIGGGGEGVIEQLKGRQVVAVDMNRRELDEAPGDPLLKIVMDARDLKFVDKSFATTTVFFTFMYISPSDHEKVFQEINRVLKPGGRLLIWDGIFPKKTDPQHLYIMFPLHVKLPATEINTGYGVLFNEGQNAARLIEVAKKTGFELISHKDENGWFSVEFRKPAA